MEWLALLVRQPWEVLAVLLGIAYVVLAARESILCWPCALASTAIFTLLFWDASLLMESGLNVYYMAMALYGWWHWTRGRPEGEAVLPIRSWPLRKHLMVVLLAVGLSLISGTLLFNYSWAVFPYLDSFTTWASVITTWMVARKILENWLYWVVIDALSIFLYLNRELYLTALLFAAYVLIAAYGWWVWRRRYLQQNLKQRQVQEQAA